MKKAGSYIVSFIISILLIFSLIASIGCISVKSFAKADKIIKLTEEKNISSLVYSGLEKYFSERYSISGIPAEIYMDAIDEDYLKSVIDDKIRYGFLALDNSYDGDFPKELDSGNNKLDQNISNFYSDYADSIGYEKDEKYDEKLSVTKKNTYRVINEYCDVFKFKALSDHGVLDKIKPLYSRLSLLTNIFMIVSVILALLLLIINISSKRDTLYWIGVSAVSSGILGAAPCIYLIATNYFSSFTIKQAHIYTAYTSAMTKITNNFMSASVTTAVSGILIIIIYVIISAAINKKPSLNENKTETE